MKHPGVYLIDDRTTGKVYLGATEDGISRFRNHNADLKNERHHNKELQKAWSAGHDLEVNFVTLGESDDPFAIEDGLIREFMPSGLLYNQARGMGSRKHTAESIEKMRQAHQGKTLSEEHRRKISEGCTGKNVGKKRTPEQREVGKRLRMETQAKAVVVEGNFYPSVREAAVAHGTNVGTASSRLRSGTERFSGWQYVQTPEKQPHD